MNVARFGLKVKNIYGTWIYGRLERDFKGRLNFNFSVPQDSCDSNDAEPDMETLCQCTGLRDSVGNLIYENDIVRVVDRDYTVVYHEPSMSYEINGETDDRDFSTLVSWVKQGVICMVVGNKFDKEKKIMDSSWESYRPGGCDPTSVNNERRLDSLEARCSLLERKCWNLQQQYNVQFLYTLSTLDVIAQITKDEVIQDVVKTLKEKIENEMTNEENKTN